MAKIPESQVEQAIREGSFAYKPGTKVTIKDKEGGVFEIPSEEIKEALDQGYSIETSQDKAVREYVSENDNLKGQAKVALGQFADEAALGIPELMYDKSQPQLDVKKKDALKKHFENTNDLAGVAGFGASFLVGGPVFKAGTKAGLAAEKAVATRLSAHGIERGSSSIAKDIVARSASNAAKLGVEGAVVSAPHALTEAALGDPEAAAESLFANGGIGMALGLASGPLSRGLSGLASKVSKNPEAGLAGFLGELSDERAAKALGFSKGQIKKLKGGQKEAEEIGNYMMDAVLEGGEKVITPTSSIDDIMDRVTRLQSESGERLGQVYKQLDETGIAKERLFDLEGKLRTKAASDFQGRLYSSERKIMEDMIADIGDIRIGKPIEGMQGPALEGVADAMSNPNGKIGLADVRDYMNRIADVAFPKGVNLAEPSPRQAVAKKVWGLLREEVDKVADEAVKATGDDSIKAILNSSRKEYAMATKAKRALEDKISSMAGNKLIGLTDTIAGAGAAAVDPVTLIPTILAKKTFERYGNQVGAHLFRKASDGILMAERFMDRAKSKLDEIPGFINTPQDVKASITSKSLGAISRLLEEHEDGKERNQALQFKKLQDVVSNIMTNSEKSMDEVAGRLQALEDGGASDTAKALAAQMVKSTQYVYNNMPKQPWNNSPFQKFNYQPTDREMASFARKMDVVLDPFAAIDALKGDTLTKDHVEALVANYPKIYISMRNRVLDTLADEKNTIPYAKRLNLSLLLGLNAEQSLMNIQAYQDAFRGPGAQRAAQAEAAETSGLRVSGLERLEPSKTYETPAQRMQRERPI